MKYFLIICCFFIGCISAKGQGKNSFEKEFRFIDYLTSNGEYDDAIFLLNKEMKNFSFLTAGQKDSLNYLMGWNLYHIKTLDSSAFYLSRVSIQSVFYEKSKFYQGFDYLYLHRIQEGREVFRNTQLKDSSLIALRNFELAGASLLERNLKEYDSLATSFTHKYYAFSEEEKKMNVHRTKLAAVKSKSPFVAGMLSSVVPGSGKYYSGMKGQAISAFLIVMSLAGVSAECYFRGGPQSTQFIAATTVFAIFYIGNIWGSVFSAKVKKDEILRDIDDDILYDLHVPLRRTFN